MSANPPKAPHLGGTSCKAGLTLGRSEDIREAMGQSSIRIRLLGSRCVRLSCKARFGGAARTEDQGGKIQRVSPPLQKKKSEVSPHLPDLGTGWVFNQRLRRMIMLQGKCGTQVRVQFNDFPSQRVTSMSGGQGPRWCSSPVFRWGEAPCLTQRCSQKVDGGVTMCRNK